MKEYVHRWPLIADHGTVLDLHVVSRRRTPEQHVKVARCDQRQPGLHLVTVLGFTDPDGAELV